MHIQALIECSLYSGLQQQCEHEGHEKSLLSIRMTIVAVMADNKRIR